MTRILSPLLLAAFVVLLDVAAPAAGDDGQRLLTIDHYVRVTSKVPAISGQLAQIYVRERVSAGVALRGAPAADKVVLFVHGAGTPAEVAFDTPIGTHSWMAYLAEAGFDVFSMDTTGYGRSTRPAPMNDPCNLAEAQQRRARPSIPGSSRALPPTGTTSTRPWTTCGRSAASAR
jgi:pimeloyl-ACP methyl ester carboxylesterase